MWCEVVGNVTALLEREGMTRREGTMSRTPQRVSSRGINFVPALTLLLGTGVTLVTARFDAQCTTQASGAIVLAPTNGEGQSCTPGGPPPVPAPPQGPLLSGETFSMSV